MKRLGFRFAALICLLIVAVFLGTASIGEPVSAASCNGIETSLVNCDGAKDTTGSPVVAILVVVIQIITGAIGVVAVGALIYAGILYSSASGNASQTTKAKDIIRNTLIGLLLFAGMAVLLNYLIPGGLFSGSAKFGAGGNGQGSVTANKLTRPTADDDDDKDDTDIDTGVVTNGACYNVGYDGKPARGREYHRHGSQSYAFENSPQGIRYAASHGYSRIDIDLRTSKEGTIIATHSPDPLNKKEYWGGFRDTAGKIKNRKTKVYNMTLAEVKRLKHVDGYTIHTLEEMIKVAAKEKILLDFEIKQPKQIKPQLPYIAALANKYKVEVTIKGKVNKSYPGMEGTLDYAQRLGFSVRDIISDKRRSIKKDTALCKELANKS